MNNTQVKPYRHFKEDPAQTVALACGRSIYDSNHTGLLVKIGRKIKMMHFAWHEDLGFNEDFMDMFKDRKLLWLNFEHYSPERDPNGTNREVLIGYANTVFKKNAQSVAYGVGYYGQYFDEDGELFLTNDTVGLTCATFLMAFFKGGLGLELLLHNEWEPREGDEEFRAKTVASMKKTGVSRAHIKKVEEEYFGARYLPEEVTASSAFVELPAGFIFCEPLGAEINAKLYQ